MQAAFPPSDYYGASAPPAAISWHRACPPLAWQARGKGGRGRFPRSPSADRRGRHPAIPRQPRQRLRRGLSPWHPCPETLPGHERGRLITGCARLLHTGPYPPGLSRLTVYRTSSLVPRVCLPVLLAGPGPSGSTGPSRRCQGCSRPPRRSPGQAALSFTRLPRQPGGGVLSPPLGTDSASWRTASSLKRVSVRPASARWARRYPSASAAVRAGAGMW
jgi:hypothetical protein